MSDIYQRAINAFGEENQINKAIEECAEFIAIAVKGVKWQRIDDQMIDVNNSGERTVDEIADLTIMMQQMRLIFGSAVVDERIAFKLARLEQLIADKSDK